MRILRKIRYSYEWQRHQIWFLIGIIFAGALIVNTTDLSPVLKFLIFLPTLVYVFLNLRLMAIFPNSVNDQEQFSWKYLQSLPISKRDLYHLFILSNFFTALPLLVLSVCYFPFITEYLFVEFRQFPVTSACFLVALCLFSILRFFHGIVVYPREAFSKIDRRLRMLLRFRDMFYTFVGILLGLIGTVLLRIGIEKFFPSVWNWLVAHKLLLAGGIAALYLYYDYRNEFQVWLDERRGTPKNNWKFRRDVPMMIAVIGVIVSPIVFLSNMKEDGGPRLHEAVISGSLEGVKYIIAQGDDVNSANFNGYTPLMVAAKWGHKEIFFYLLSRGARKDLLLENVLSGKWSIEYLAILGGDSDIVSSLIKHESLSAYRHRRGESYLHLAASRCHPEIVDYLVSLGANVNELTETGSSPLHQAAEARCFPVVLSLMEAGADPLIKDRSGKLALEYGRPAERLPTSYLEKKYRK